MRLVKHPGPIFSIVLTSDFLVRVPDWANWIFVQPCGQVCVSEYEPRISAQGWVDEKISSDGLGFVEDGAYWKESLEPIQPCPTPISAPTGTYHAIHRYLISIPDDTTAVTMEADGAVVAWTKLPAYMDDTWFGRDGDPGYVVGWHAEPYRFARGTCIYVATDDSNAISHGPLQ